MVFVTECAARVVQRQTFFALKLRQKPNSAHMSNGRSIGVARLGESTRDVPYFLLFVYCRKEG